MTIQLKYPVDSTWFYKKAESRGTVLVPCQFSFLARTEKDIDQGANWCSFLLSPDLCQSQHNYEKVVDFIFINKRLIETLRYPWLLNIQYNFFIYIDFWHKKLK